VPRVDGSWIFPWSSFLAVRSPGVSKFLFTLLIFCVLSFILYPPPPPLVRPRSDLSSPPRKRPRLALPSQLSAFLEWVPPTFYFPFFPRVNSCYRTPCSTCFEFFSQVRFSCFSKDKFSVVHVHDSCTCLLCGLRLYQNGGPPFLQKFIGFPWERLYGPADFLAVQNSLTPFFETAPKAVLERFFFLLFFPISPHRPGQFPCAVF